MPSGFTMPRPQWPGLLLAAAVVATAPPVSGQRVFQPGDPALVPDRLVPFEAEYEQVGVPFLVRLTHSAGPPAVWSLQMIAEAPSGVQIDHVGHYAADLSFAYRRFGFGAFRPEVLDARAADGTLTLRRLMLTDSQPPPAPPARVSVPLEAPVFDGTAAFWLLATLPLADGFEGRLRTWGPTPDGVETRLTPPFRVTGRDTVTTADGRTWHTWIVTVVSGPVTFRSWVAPTAPFLIRQEMRREGAAPEVVVELKRLRSAP